MNDLHLTVGGFVAQQQPNVNAAYGPWTTVEEARIFLERTFLSILDGIYVPKIPTGTTVAVYTDDTQLAICEYWWIRNELTPKTYGEAQYLLELVDSEGKKVTYILMDEDCLNTPTHIIPIDMATQGLVSIGYILFSIDEDVFYDYSPNSETHRLGIPTEGIKRSLVVNWLNNDGSLLSRKDISVHYPSDITLSFFAYNNDEENSPKVAKYITTNDSYQDVDWTPNEYGESIWSSILTGITTKNRVEWKVTRSRKNGVWDDLQGPFITGRWGHDGIGIVAVDKLTLYYYSETLINKKLDDYFDDSCKYLNIHVPRNETFNENYEVTDEAGFKWQAKYESTDPYTRRYCYVTQRFKSLKGSDYDFGTWTTPALYSNFAVDGKDADDVEYIYSRSKSELLSSEALAELAAINSNYTSNESTNNIGGEIPFDKLTYWTDDPSGVELDIRYEFCSRRRKTKDAFGNIVYLAFDKPFMWAYFGKEGPDGPGLEYIYILTEDSSEVPSIEYPKFDCNNREKKDNEYLPKYGSKNWSDNPLSTSSAYPILWMSLRKGRKDNWSDFTHPVIWNQFLYSYDLRLTNDNCSIPSDITGTYTIESAKKATATQVELFLGTEKIDIVKEGITITCDNYTCEGDTYYLNEPITINEVHISVFKATNKLGKVIALRSQVVTLTYGKTAYLLKCFPNSRIWYGGHDYSVEEFTISVYSLDERGIYKELDSTNCGNLNLSLHYQKVDEETVVSDFNINNGKFTIGLDSGDSDIHLFLCQKQYDEQTEKYEYLLLDTEVIDTVDYSKIKGKDSSSITIDINDLINIPKNKVNDINYIKERTKTKIVAYKDLKLIPIKEVTASAVDISDPISGTVNISQVVDNEGNAINTFYIDLALKGDVIVTYSVFIDIDGEEVLYDKVQTINISSDLIVYELRPHITNIVYNKSAGPNVGYIEFDILTNDDKVPEHSIKYSIDIDDQEYTGEFDDKTFDFTPAIIEKLKISKADSYILKFSLHIQGIEGAVDYESINIVLQPESSGHNYVIDLSNPSLRVPKGFKEGLLQEWSANTITVYKDGSKVDNFTVNLPNGESWVNVDNPENTYFTTYPENVDTDNIYEVHYQITVDSMTLYRSQSVIFTDDTEYSLISNPTQVVLNKGQSQTIPYKPTIKKALNGIITTITKEDFNNESLVIKLKEASYYSLDDLWLNIDSLDSVISAQLMDQNDSVLDVDDIAVVRNGSDGSGGGGDNTYELYGRAIYENILYIVEDLENDDITTLTKDGFEGHPNKKDGIFCTDKILWLHARWGITDTYKQEFVTVSTYIDPDQGWSPFSPPVINALFGEKGEDGDGVEYIYTACNGLSTTVVKDDNGNTIGFKVNDPIPKNKDGYPILGTHYESDGKLFETETDKALDEDDCILPGWYDNIPDLSADFPDLYMTYRKRSNGVWGYFTEPVRWNKYSTSLELILDNNCVIIDDNSNNEGIKEVSSTTVNAYYKGKEIDSDLYKYLVKASPSNELEEYFEIKQEGNSFHLEKKPNVSLTDGISGQVTYSFTYPVEKDENGKPLKTETITRKQEIIVKDFSAGEAYKLILSPNSIPLKILDNRNYIWEDNLTIDITVLKIKGIISTKIELTNFDQEGLKLFVNDGTKKESIGTSYPVPNSKLDGNKWPPSINVLLEKNETLVDSLTINFSAKGVDGKTPLIINLTDDTDAIFVDADTTGPLIVDTNVLVFFNGDDITSKLKNPKNITVTIDLEYLTLTGITIPENSDPNPDPTKIVLNIPYTCDSNVLSSLKLSIPVKVSVNYNDIETELTVYYHINIFKNFIRRELYPSVNIIRKDQNGNLSPNNIEIQIREFKDGIELIYFPELGNSQLLHIWIKSDTETDYADYIEKGSSSYPIPPNAENVTFILKQGDTELDVEVIPVIKDGTDGNDGKDGNGVEYIYTACGTLDTDVLYKDNNPNKEIIGFKVKGSPLNSYNLPIYGTHSENGELVKNDDGKDLDDDEFILPGWFDDMPDLSESYPNLYMSTRKKINGVWGPFKKPTRWNKYSSNLELILDNDCVIIDDNSDNDTIQNLSKTTVTAYYKGTEIQTNIKVELSNELGNYFTSLQEGSSFYLTRQPNTELKDGISGQVTYKFTYSTENGEETITRKQEIIVKDFSVGEGYKLMLTPNVIPVNKNSDGYSWKTQPITINVILIKGSTSSDVVVTSLNFKLYECVDGYEKLLDIDETLENNNGTLKYTIEGKNEVNDLKPISIVLKKNDVLVDSQTITFSTKGADANNKFKSTVFTRTDAITQKPKTPTGGSYADPIPEDTSDGDKKIWSDGIPEFDSGKRYLWSSYRYFSEQEGGISYWSEPQLMLDSDEFDVAYSTKLSDPGVPTGHGANHGNDWSNEPSEEAIWMATSNRLAGGVWSNWLITKIKGEDGISGESPIIINLTDDTDAIFVDDSTTGNKDATTTVQAFFEGDPATIDEITLIRNETVCSENNHLKYPDNPYVEIILDKDKNTNTVKCWVPQTYYSNTNTNNLCLKIIVPLKVTAYSGNVYTTQQINYHVNIFKNLVRRELYSNLNVIKKDSDLSIWIAVKEFKDGTESIICPTLVSVNNELLILSYKKDSDSGWTQITGNSNYDRYIVVKSDEKNIPYTHYKMDVSENKSEIQFRLENTNLDGSRIEIDREVIPVIKDGKDGTNGTNGANGKNASLRMAGEWNSTTTYYCLQELGNVLYTDVVAYRGDDKLLFYFAKQTNTNKIPPNNPKDWDPVLQSDLTLTLLLLIYNKEAGNISGGFVDVENQQTDKEKTADGIILWAGGNGTTELESAKSATFSVTRSGVIRAKEGLFEGMYASKMKVFDKMPVVEELPFIPEITLVTEDEEKTYWIPNIVDFNKLTETSHFLDDSVENTYFELKFKNDNKLKLTTESTPTIYLPSGFMLPKYTADEAERYVQALYAMSLIEPISGTFDEIFSSRTEDGYGFYSDSPGDIILKINDILSNSDRAGVIFNNHLIKWLLGQKNRTMTVHKTTTIEKLLGDVDLPGLLYEYHRTQFLNALPYVGKTFTFINAPEIKGLRGLVMKKDEYYVPANQIESEYSNDIQAINIMHETLPTLFELGHYIAIKDWPRYTKASKGVGDAYDAYDTTINNVNTTLSIYNDTKLISVLCKLIPLDIDKRTAYIGWDVVSGPFNKVSSSLTEIVPTLKFPSIIIETTPES